MASRLYRTTRQLYLAVEAALVRLHLNTMGTPTLAALIALAVTGLILLDARPTQTRVARVCLLAVTMRLIACCEQCLSRHVPSAAC
jgi:hypothetical protein